MVDPSSLVHWSGEVWIIFGDATTFLRKYVCSHILPPTLHHPRLTYSQSSIPIPLPLVYSTYLTPRLYPFTPSTPRPRLLPTWEGAGELVRWYTKP